MHVVNEETFIFDPTNIKNETKQLNQSRALRSLSLRTHSAEDRTMHPPLASTTMAEDEWWCHTEFWVLAVEAAHRVGILAVRDKKEYRTK